MGTQRDRRNPHRRRITIVSIAAIVALALGATAVHAALDQDTTTAAAPRATATPSVPEPSVPEPSVPDATDEPLTPEPSPSEPAQQPSATPSPSPDPYALADGVYPAYLRKVNVGAGTLTVDVVQLFTDTQARVAAREDGMSWQESRYLQIYIRNENDLLRTLVVTPGATITFADGCVAEDRHGGLEQLRKDSTPYTDSFYYQLTVEDGSVVGVAQEYAVVGC